MTSILGTRVVRGSDWEGGEADGGEGYLGTVVSLLDGGEVGVVWDIGHESTCKAGRDGKYTLRVFDSAPAGVRHPSVVCAECRVDGIWGTVWRCRTCAQCDLCTYCYSEDKHFIGHEFTRIDFPGDEGHPIPRRKLSVRSRVIGIFPGAKVTRGRDWCLGDEDGGPGSEGEVEARETTDHQRNRVRVKWLNGTVSSCRLGFEGQVDIACIEEEVGPFYYRDHLALLDVAKAYSGEDEQTAKLKTLRTYLLADSASCPQTEPGVGMSREPVGTSADEAEKAPNEKEQIEKGQIEKGRLEKGRIEKERSQNENKENEFKDDGLKEKECEKEQQKAREQLQELDDRSFASGDCVAIKVGATELRELQKDHGGFTARMIKCIGKTGHVTRLAAKDTVAVSFGSLIDLIYRYNPAALVKVSEFHEGDIVQIKNDCQLVRIFNSRVGWTSQMEMTIGKIGKVLEIDRNKNLWIQFGNCCFFFAPAGCLHAPGAPTDEISASDFESKGQLSDDYSENRRLFRRVRETVFGPRQSIEGADNMSRLHAAIANDDEVTLRHMCQQDPSMMNCEYKGMNPLILAAFRGSMCCTKALVELGADVNHCMSDDVNKTPLSAALDKGYEDIGLYLLDHGANPNHKYERGDIAIHLAVSREQNRVVQSLIDHGVDVNAKNRFYDTALHMAISMKKYDIVETLLTVPHLDLYIPDQRGFNALHLACFMGRPRAVELILERDRGGVEQMKQGHSTALHIAAVNDHVECVRLLVINGGADVNAKDGQGRTALHLTCSGAKITTAEALLELGADVNVADNDGYTQLHLAIGCGIKDYGKSDEAALEATCRAQLSNMLISAGAFVDAEDKKGRGPLTYGVPEVRQCITEFIRKNKHAVKTQRKSPDAYSQSEAISLFPSVSLLSLGPATEMKDVLRRGEMPCAVCRLSQAEVSLQPCDHKCVCRTCSQKITRCPVCNAAVSEENTLPSV